MPFLNFGGNKNKQFNLSDMNFFMKNMKNRYSDPDPLWNRIRIHLFPNVDPRIRIHYYGKVDPRIRIHFPKCGSQDPDPDPRQNEMDPKRCLKLPIQHLATDSSVGLSS